MAAPFRAAVDGGSRGNPGTAAWAVVVLDRRGEVLEGHGGLIGHATNNVAEYQALLEALKLASEKGAETVEILADSELIVRQVQGRYKVRHPDLIPLHAEVARRIPAFRSFRIEHVPREKNREADQIVNRVLDRASEITPGDTLHLYHRADAGTAGDS
jgi:ribonuclease HI